MKTLLLILLISLGAGCRKREADARAGSRVDGTTDERDANQLYDHGHGQNKCVMKQFKYRRRITLNANGPVENVEWKVPPSRHYRLVIDEDSRAAWLEFNDAKRLPTIKVVGDGKRAQKKMKNNRKAVRLNTKPQEN